MSYVYFIQAGADGPIKVGWAVDPIERLAILQTGTHETLRIIGTVDGGQKLEHEFHVRLKHLHIRGEWFKPTIEIRDLMCEYAAGTRQDKHRRTASSGREFKSRCCVCDVALLPKATDEPVECYDCAEFKELREAGVDPFEDAA